MNLIERMTSKAFYENDVFYHSVESAKGFFEGVCKKHNVEGWTFKIVSSTKKYNIGYCSYSRKVIAVQARVFFAMSGKMLEEIILHELAHALTPAECKDHGDEWKANARKLGVPLKATCNLSKSEGFRKDWTITSGHTRRESEFDISAFTEAELPRSKKPSSPNFGGNTKRVYKPTKLAMSIYAEKKNEDNIWLWEYNFTIEFTNCGYKESYAKVQWDLCKSFCN